MRIELLTVAQNKKVRKLDYTMSMRIVVAEDEFQMRTSLITALEWKGYQVFPAENGEKALHTITLMSHGRQNADLLICDIQMPKMNGEELIRKLHELEYDIPIIAITGYGERDLLIRLMRLGCTDFIDKPFTPQILEERVRLLFDKSQNSILEKTRKRDLLAINEKSRSLVHDLNNILSGTLGFADMALEELESTHSAHQKIKKVYATAKLAAEICQNLLELKPGESNTSKIQTEIRSIVERICAVLMEIAPKSIHIETSMPNFPVWLYADSERIQQALLNLGINAVDAMNGKGNLKFTVSILDEFRPDYAKPEKCVCICVSDNGPGISPENSNRLFNEKFTTKENGHGFGLLIVKEIIDEHSGWITVNSKENLKTEFNLFFPAIRKE